MKVQPTHYHSIGHRNYHYRVDTQRFGVIATDVEKNVTYVDDQRVVHSIPGNWGRLYTPAILDQHQDQQRLAITHQNGLSVVDPGGEIIFECEVPESESRDPSHRCYFGGCHFDPQLKELWLTAPLSPEQYELMILDTKTWKFVHRLVVDDLFSGSDQTFYPTFQPGIVGMDLTTGGCGEETFILDRNNDAIEIENAEIGDSRYHVFSPRAKNFMVVEGHTEILQYGYPAVGYYGGTENLCEQLDEFSKGDGSSVGSSMAFVSPYELLISNDDDVLAILDLHSWRIKEKVEVELPESRRPKHSLLPSWTWFSPVHEAIAFWHGDGFFTVPREQF